MEYKLLKECVKLYDSLHQTPKYIEKGFSMVRVKDLKEGFLDIKNPVFVSEEDYLKFTKKYKPQKGDIIFSRVGSYGISSYINFEKNFCLGQNTVLIHPIDIDNKYLYYLFTSPIIKRQIEEKVTGSTQKTISLKSINEFSIPIPTLKHQRKIGETLFNIDLKIETNKKLISLLEDISQNLFKHWFIDFEFPNEEGKPYKSSGGEMVESELGEIPKGWNLKYLSENVDFLSGGTPKTKEETYWNGTIPFFTPKDAKNSLYTTTTEKSITDLGLEKCNSKLYPKNTLFITARGTVGKLALANRPMAMNQSCFALKHKEGKQFYLYNVVENLVKEIILGANGAVFNAINLNDLKRLKYAYSNERLIINFENKVSRFYEKMSLLEEENINLQQLRDTLLPKLLSGEIEIPDDLEV